MWNRRQSRHQAGPLPGRTAPRRSFLSIFSNRPCPSGFSPKTEGRLNKTAPLRYPAKKRARGVEVLFRVGALKKEIAVPTDRAGVVNPGVTPAWVTWTNAAMAFDKALSVGAGSML